MPFGPWPGGPGGGPLPTGSVITSDRLFARDMTAPTPSHPVLVGMTLLADPTYPQLVVGSAAQGGNKGLCFRAQAPSIATHGTNAGALRIQVVAKPQVLPVAGQDTVRYRLYTQRILDGVPLTGWDSLALNAEQVFPADLDFEYFSFFAGANLVFGVQINLAAGEFFEGEIYRESPIAAELLDPADLYAIDLIWIAA